MRLCRTEHERSLLFWWATYLRYNTTVLYLIKALQKNASIRPLTSSGGSGFAVSGAVGWPYFQQGAQNYTIAATELGFGEKGVRQGSGVEAEAVSLNYTGTLILDLRRYNEPVQLICFIMNFIDGATAVQNFQWGAWPPLPPLEPPLLTDITDDKDDTF